MQQLLKNKDLLQAMISMPEGANNVMVETRRRELFSVLHEETSMTEVEVMEQVREREREFVEEYQEDPIPEWLMRMEAQDVFLQFIHQRFEDEVTT